MKSIYKAIMCGLCSCILLASCEEEDTRKVFPHSTPVIESAAINPSTFSYGDSVTITAKVSDPTTPLSTLEMKMIVNDVLVAQQSIRTLVIAPKYLLNLRLPIQANCRKTQALKFF